MSEITPLYEEPKGPEAARIKAWALRWAAGQCLGPNKDVTFKGSDMARQLRRWADRMEKGE